MKILVSGEIRELRYRDSNGLDTMYDILLAEKAIYDKKKGIPVLRKPEEFEDWKIFANEQHVYYGTAVPWFRRSGNRLSGTGNRCSSGVSRLSGAAGADTEDYSVKSLSKP